MEKAEWEKRETKTDVCTENDSKWTTFTLTRLTFTWPTKCCATEFRYSKAITTQVILTQHSKTTNQKGK